MHLHDALLDEQGSAYAAGQFDLPASPDGAYPSVSGKLVRVRSESGLLTLAAARAHRDLRSGYLVGKSSSPVVYLNSVVSDILKDALRFGERRASTFSFDAKGALRDPAGESNIQDLSDWRGRIESLGEDSVRVELSAALSPAPALDAVPSTRQHWNAGGINSLRLRVAFSMDAATRVLAMRAHSRALPQLPLAKAAPLARTTIDAMRLKSTPIGSGGGIFGVTDDGRSVELYEGRSPTNSSFVIHRPGRAVRTASGLLEGTNEFPRIWLEGFDLDTVARSLRRGLTFAVAVSGSSAGEVDFTGGGSDGPGHSERLVQARCDFELTRDGLIVVYEAQPENAQPLRGQFTVPWEVLIIRSPLFVRLRDRVRG
ncbi:MAG: hypothetical protein JWR04_2012 [Rhodoglobus sp.]|nr:hypothetical protein [Rhodoglobus sp.]